MVNAVLHAQSINRQVDAPIHIGHHDYISVDTAKGEDDVFAGVHHVELGCPLFCGDMGSERTHIPLVKSVEYEPDPNRYKGHVLSENLYYRRGHDLIPFRTKVRSGEGQGLILNHLPSLNEIRRDIAGFSNKIVDPVSGILCDVIMNDPYFQTGERKHLHDWITGDFFNYLDRSPVNRLSFDTQNTSKTISDYLEKLQTTPGELNLNHLRHLSEKMIIPPSHIPHAFQSSIPLLSHPQDFRYRFVRNEGEFGFFDNIKLSHLSHIDYNPQNFQSVADLLDKIPLTDFNVDIGVDVGGEIQFFDPHLALDRFEAFADYESFSIEPRNILIDWFTESEVNAILGLFFNHHSSLTPRAIDVLHHEPLRMQVMKSFSDEAAILVYPARSDNNQLPLCGVYFDLALWSLAPMTLIGEHLAH